MVAFLCFCYFVGLDEAQCLPCLHHFVQAGAAGSPGVQTEILAVPNPGRSPKHQELQVPTLAKPAELQQVSREWWPAF